MFSDIKIKLILLAVVLVAIFGAYKYVTGLQDKVTNLQAEVTTLSTKLQTQNDAIIQMKKDATARIDSHKAELANAKKLADASKGKAQIIYKIKPSTPGDMCKSALDMINGSNK